jgi:hypothetical protein
MMEYGDQCKMDPTMPLKYACTRYNIHLATLVIINLYTVMMSQSGDITTLALEGPGHYHGYPRHHPELGFSSWTTFMRHWHMWAGFQSFGGPTFHPPCPTFHT